MAQARVLVVGSSNADFIVQVDHLPVPGETVTEGRFRQVFGGKGANQAVAAARAGAQVTFVGCVGTDALGEQMLANFKAEGLDVSHLKRSADQPSGTAIIMIGDHDGNNCIAVAPGANHALTADDVDAAAACFGRADAVVLQMEIPPAAIERVLALAERHGNTVVMNYAPTRGVPVKVDPRMTVLVVNESEAEALLGGGPIDAHDAADAARRLQQQGPPTVVITLGEAGCVAVDAAGAHRLPGKTVQPVDTTAAGDTFCGVLATSLAEGLPLNDALARANVAGALATLTVGAQPSIPRREQIDAGG